MYRRMVDQVVVVDHDDQRLGEVGEDVHDGRDERLLIAVGTADELPQRARRRRKRFADGGDEVGPESGRIRVGVLDLQPGGGLRALGQPRCQQRRLARTGRGARKHQPDVAGEAGVEPIGESRSLHEPVGQRRRHQLRRCQSAVPVPGHGVDPTSPRRRAVTDLTRVRSPIVGGRLVPAAFKWGNHHADRGDRHEHRRPPPRRPHRGEPSQDLIRSAARSSLAANRQPASDRRRIVTARRRAVLAGAASRPTTQTVLAMPRLTGTDHVRDRAAGPTRPSSPAALPRRLHDRHLI